jgi:L-iditol 2-dehydrogenase
MKLNGGMLADAVIEGTGTGAALNQAVDCVKTFGTIVLLGNPHKDTTIKLSNHSKILRKEINLAGVWNSHYADTPINEWKYTVRMIDSGKMIVDDLVTHRCGLDDIPRLCEDIYMQRVDICKALYSAGAQL